MAESALRFTSAIFLLSSVFNEMKENGHPVLTVTLRSTQKAFTLQGQYMSLI